MEEWVFTDGTGGLHRRPMPAHLRRRPAAYQAAVPIFDPYAPGPGPFAGPGGTVAPGQREPWGDAPTPAARSFAYQATGYDDAWGPPPALHALAWNPTRRLYEPSRNFTGHRNERPYQQQLYDEYVRLAPQGVFVQAYQDEAAPGTWRFRWVRVRTPWPSLEQPYQVLGDYGERFFPGAQRAIEAAHQRRLEAVEAARKLTQAGRQRGEGPAAAWHSSLDRVLMSGPAHAYRAPPKPGALSDYAWIAQQALPKGCPYPYPYMPVPQQDYATGAWLSPDYTPSIPLPPPFDLIPWRCSVPAAPGEYKGKGRPSPPRDDPMQLSDAPGPGGAAAGAAAGAPGAGFGVEGVGILGTAEDLAGAGRVARGILGGDDKDGAPGEPAQAPPSRPPRDTTFDEETERALKKDPDVQRTERRRDEAQKDVEELDRRLHRARDPRNVAALKEKLAAAQERLARAEDQYLDARDSAAVRFNEQRVRDLERERRGLENKKRTTWSPERKERIDAEIAAVNHRIDWAQYYVTRIARQRLEASGAVLPQLTSWAADPRGVDSDPEVRARIEAQRKAEIEVLELMAKSQEVPEGSYQQAALLHKLHAARQALAATRMALATAREVSARAVSGPGEPAAGAALGAGGAGLEAAIDRQLERLAAEKARLTRLLKGNALPPAERAELEKSLRENERDGARLASQKDDIVRAREAALGGSRYGSSLDRVESPSARGVIAAPEENERKPGAGAAGGSKEPRRLRTRADICRFAERARAAARRLRGDRRGRFLAIQASILDRLCRGEGNVGTSAGGSDDPTRVDWLVRVLEVFQGSLENYLAGNLHEDAHRYSLRGEDRFPYSQQIERDVIEGVRAGPWWTYFDQVVEALTRRRIAEDDAASLVMAVFHINGDLHWAIHSQGHGTDEDWARLEGVVSSATEEVLGPAGSKRFLEMAQSLSDAASSALPGALRFPARGLNIYEMRNAMRNGVKEHLRRGLPAKANPAFEGSWTSTDPIDRLRQRASGIEWAIREVMEEKNGIYRGKTGEFEEHLEYLRRKKQQVAERLAELTGDR